MPETLLTGSDKVPKFFWKKLTSKYHWELLIYGLIYPGFVGSMIYDLFIVDNKLSSFKFMNDSVYLLKWVVTFYYCLDYVHLYGDIEKKIKDDKQENKKTWRYLLCDLVSCVLLFFTYSNLHQGHNNRSLFCIAIVPICFLIYKWNTGKELWIHGIYVVTSLAFGTYLLLNHKSETHASDLEQFVDLKHFIWGSTIFYFFYVTIIYEHCGKKFHGKRYA